MMVLSPYNATVTDAVMSIVVHGPVITKQVPKKINDCTHGLKGGITQNVLAALKDLFPQAELILSTWEDAPLEGIVADKICVTPNPGSVLVHPRMKEKSHLNQYVVSAAAGINAATRPYTLRLRSDLLFVTDDFVQFWNDAKPSLRSSEYTIFQDFILNPALFARKSVCPARKTFPLYFHPSNWAHFGRTEDLALLFDIPLFDEATTARFFLNNPLLRNQFEDPTPELYAQFYPSQQVFLACLAKQGWDITYPHRLAYQPELQELSDQLMCNNFIFLDQSQWLFFNLKQPFMQVHLSSSQYYGLYSFEVWQADYARLVNATYQPVETPENGIRADWLKTLIHLPEDHYYPLSHQLHPQQPGQQLATVMG